MRILLVLVVYRVGAKRKLRACRVRAESHVRIATCAFPRPHLQLAGLRHPREINVLFRESVDHSLFIHNDR